MVGGDGVGYGDGAGVGGAGWVGGWVISGLFSASLSQLLARATCAPCPPYFATNSVTGVRRICQPSFAKHSIYLDFGG